MSSTQTSQRPHLKIVPPQAVVAKNVSGAEIIEDEVCDQCGGKLQLTVDAYGIYDFHCIHRGHSITTSMAHDILNLFRKK